ncbi:MAG: peptidoglycan editing factor PgeF [Aerococcus sp.]|nr:peptidoglycan editing factor PgeF [Aerococcus sp.]
MSIHYYQQTPSVTAGTTLRDATLPAAGSMGIGNPETHDAVMQNRQSFLNTLKITRDQWIQARQTHSDVVCEVTHRNGGWGFDEIMTAVQDCDGLYTMESELMLAIFTADCVPVIFWDETSPLIGVIHSGWRGTVQGITPKALLTIQNEKGIALKNLRVILGPSLAKAHFEVDEDVYLRFKHLGYTDNYSAYRPETHKYHIDNQGVVYEQCRRIGIPEENITRSTFDTFSEETGFSYRQNKTKGRHMSFIIRHDD